MKTRFLMLWMLCLLTLNLWGQSRITEGRVITASDHEPVIGASVKVKDSPTGVITDLEGRFSVSAPPETTLIISFIGYRTCEVKANGQKNLEVKLEEDTQMLETVVVVGYGTAKKSDLTGAVVSANIKDFEKAPNTKPDAKPARNSAGTQHRTVRCGRRIAFHTDSRQEHHLRKHRRTHRVGWNHLHR